MRLEIPAAPAEMRALIEAAGFRALAWQDATAELAGPSPGAAVAISIPFGGRHEDS